jgi:hypothetical protein
MANEKGRRAAEAYVRAIRSGEHAASLALAKLLSPDVELETNGPMPNAPTETIKGYDRVLARASGNYAWTNGLRNARWDNAKPEGDGWRIDGDCQHMGGVAGASVSVLVKTDAQGKITRIEQKYTPKQVQATDRIPLSARPLINNARINETTIAVAYTDENGNPSLTYRGSIQVLDDHRLCAWIRQAEGGLARSIAKNPRMSMAYRDGARAMLLIEGRGRIDNSEATRELVWEMTPEGEQNHDPARKGAPLIVDVDKMTGYVGGETVRMARKA